jgi:hypothetical protein
MMKILPKLEESVYLKHILDPETFAIGFQSLSGLLLISQIVGELKTQSIDSASMIRTMHEVVGIELMESHIMAGLVLNSKIDQTWSMLGVMPKKINSRGSYHTLWGSLSETVILC